MKVMMKKCLSLFVFVLCFFAIQRLLVPKYAEKPFEGALISDYYKNDHKNDLLLIGDCEVYENVSPATLWENFGISSYIRGTAKQLMWQSLEIFKESLHYETPKVVVLSVLAMMYGAPQHDSEAYNRMTLDGMRWGKEKISCIWKSMLPNEQFLSYVFPVLRYHDRWKNITSSDFHYFFRKKQASINGFVMRVDVAPVEWIPEPLFLTETQFGEMAWKALHEFVAVCAKKKIQLVLFKAPSLSPHWYEEWDKQIVEFAQKNNIFYINSLKDAQTIGLDFSVDTYDRGLHMNLSGAEKTANYLGNLLQSRYPSLLIDHRKDPGFVNIWSPKVRQYERWKAIQLEEISKTGQVETLMPIQ